MNSQVSIALHPSIEQIDRLLALQRTFAHACNSLAPLVQQTRTWNRVALHHLAYRQLREQFPQLGSQMACNVIYSVSRAHRLVLQSPGIPFHVSRWGQRPLPLLKFADNCPVYFDRHTLSIKQGRASMYTLDGRMRFDVQLPVGTEDAFRHRKLLELSLRRRAGEGFELSFVFSPEAGVENMKPADEMNTPSSIPDYLHVQAQA